MFFAFTLITLFVISFQHSKENKKLYERLGVNFAASDEEIKLAFEKKFKEMKTSGESGYNLS